MADGINEQGLDMLTVDSSQAAGPVARGSALGPGRGRVTAIRSLPPADIVSIPIAASLAADLLDLHPRYRVQRKVETMSRMTPRRRLPGELNLAVLDVETTVTDPDQDRVIELAVQCVQVDADVKIVEPGKTRNWLEDPGFDNPAEITQVTGITRDDVRGRSIGDAEAYPVISSADAVISHNAAFDRPFVERRLKMSEQPRMCSLRDFDWADAGFSSHKLESLAGRCGWFFDPHRASGDVSALIRLLDHEVGGETVVRGMLRNASRLTYLVEAPGAPFDARAALKARGYGWDGVRRLWSRHVPEGESERDVFWLNREIYAGRREPVVVRQTWRERYARGS